MLIFVSEKNRPLLLAKGVLGSYLNPCSVDLECSVRCLRTDVVNIAIVYSGHPGPWSFWVAACYRQGRVLECRWIHRGWAAGCSRNPLQMRPSWLCINTYAPVDQSASHIAPEVLKYKTMIYIIPSKYFRTVQQTSLQLSIFFIMLVVFVDKWVGPKSASVSNYDMSQGTPVIYCYYNFACINVSLEFIFTVNLTSCATDVCF